MKCESATHMSGLVEAKYVVGVGLTLCRCRNLPHCPNCRPLTAFRSWLIAIVHDDLSVQHNLLDPSRGTSYQPHWLILELQPVTLDLGILDGGRPGNGS